MTLKILGSGNIRSPEISASTLIDEQLLIDCGHGVYKRLLQSDIDISKIHSVFITHLHSDHFIDLIALISYFNTAKSFSHDYPELHVFLPPGGIEVLETITRHTINPDIDSRAWLTYAASLEEYAHETTIKTLEYEVTPILVDHGTMKPSFGLIVRTPDKTLGFSGDSKTCSGIDKIIDDSEVLILDVSDLTENIAHMGLDNFTAFATKFPEKQFFATHLSNEVRQSSISLPSNARLLCDGDII